MVDTIAARTVNIILSCIKYVVCGVSDCLTRDCLIHSVKMMFKIDDVFEDVLASCVIGDEAGGCRVRGAVEV